MKMVREYEINTLYGGDRVEWLCESHALKAKAVIEQNAQYAYYPLKFKQVSDSKEGKCKHCD